MKKFAFSRKEDTGKEKIAKGTFADWQEAVKFFSLSKHLNVEDFLKIYRVFEIYDK